MTAASVVPAATVSATSQKTMLQQLEHPDENARREAALELGRSRAQDAIEPLCVRLANDSSAQVREASARALGMIGSARAMQSLQRSAVGDGDALVRHSAQFALDVIHAHQRR
jgi:HEAT repeat protein